MNTNIIIPNILFLNRLKNIKSNSIPDVYLNKAKEIQHMPCFNSVYNSKLIWDKKKKYDKEIVVKNKIHIVITDFTDKSKIKREFISFLNKLTDSKKEDIYLKIKNLIKQNNDDEELFTILYNFIIKSDIKNIGIYLNIFNFLNNDIVTKNIDLYWNNFNENKEWIPPLYILDNALMVGNEDDEIYNLYCDYVKWKKTNNSIINMLILLIIDQSKIENLLNNIYTYLIEYISFSAKKYRHVIDILLEDMIIIMSHYKNNDIIDKIKNIDLSILENSSKFLIYNITGKK
jgi:hypothetical protein